MTLSTSWQGIQVSCEVACILFGHVHIRHRIAGDHTLWLAQPLDEVIWGVAKHAGDVNAAAELRERRADISFSLGDARNRVAGDATVGLDQCRAARGIRVDHSPMWFCGVAVASTHTDHQYRYEKCAAQSRIRQRRVQTRRRGDGRVTFRRVHTGHKQDAERGQMDEARRYPHNETCELLVLERSEP